MPLAEPNKLLVPSKIPLFRGRKPTCTRDITQKTANTTDSDDVLALSRQQKSVLIDLALFRFAEAQAGKRFSPEEEVHSTFLAKSSTRRELGAFTNALVEGMLIVKELEEDKLYAFIEFEFDRINLKDTKKQQSDVDLMKTIQLHASPFLLSIPGVSEAFSRLDRTLAKLLVPHMNKIGKRRKYSMDHLVMLNPLIIDEDIADDDDDDFDQVTSAGPSHRASPLVLALNTPTSVSSIRTASTSTSAEGYQWPNEAGEASFEREIRSSALSRQSTDYWAHVSPFDDSMAAALDGQVLGTFTPLRPAQQPRFRQSPAPSVRPSLARIPTPVRSSPARIPVFPLRPSSALPTRTAQPSPTRAAGAYRLVRVEDPLLKVPRQEAVNDTNPPYLQQLSSARLTSEERLFGAHSTRLSSQTGQNLSSSRIRQFRPSYQENHKVD